MGVIVELIEADVGFVSFDSFEISFREILESLEIISFCFRFSTLIDSFAHMDLSNVSVPTFENLISFIL